MPIIYPQGIHVPPPHPSNILRVGKADGWPEFGSLLPAGEAGWRETVRLASPDRLLEIWWALGERGRSSP